MSLPQHPLVVRGPEVQALRDAAAILAQARQDAAAERDRERQRGYDDGLNKAATAASQLFRDAAAAIAAHWAQREQELVPLALAIAHRVLSELPPDDVLAGIARTAIAEHRRDTQLTLRAPPDAAATLQRCLARDATTAHVQVQADAGLAPGRCVLSHPQGRTSIGLLEQFQAMLATVREA